MANTVTPTELLEQSAALADLRRLLTSGQAACIRRAAGLTRPGLARQLGTSVTPVYDYEYGRAFPRRSTGLRYHALLRRLEQLTGARA